MSVDNSPANLARVLLNNPDTAARTFRDIKQPDGTHRRVHTIDALTEQLSGAPVEDDPADPRKKETP